MIAATTQRNVMPVVKLISCSRSLRQERQDHKRPLQRYLQTYVQAETCPQAHNRHWLCPASRKKILLPQGVVAHSFPPLSTIAINPASVMVKKLPDSHRNPSRSRSSSRRSWEPLVSPPCQRCFPLANTKR